MAIPLIMPKQGQSVETCIITKWFRQKGEKVKTGDILFSYETDKAAFDFESPADGLLLEIFSGEGDEVPVLVNVAVIGDAGENAEPFRPSGPGTDRAGKPENKDVSEAAASGNPELPRVSGENNRRLRVSPRAKRLAREKGIDFRNVPGSGPYGRIIFTDIESVASGQKTAGKASAVKEEYTEQPLSNLRKLVAKAMHSSLVNSAQLTHHMSADVRFLLEARSIIKKGNAEGTEKNDITLNDMICWCVIKALKKFPEANSHYLDDRIRTFSSVNLGIAVDTPRGLMVPVVRNADALDLPSLSNELRSAAEACRRGNINPELIRSDSASFTVSNLGSYGVEMFTPVINLPQVAILGVCTIVSRPADLGNNVFGFVPYIGLSLTYDHRAIDGGPATLFLREIRDQIEKFRYQQ